MLPRSDRLACQVSYGATVRAQRRIRRSHHLTLQQDELWMPAAPGTSVRTNYYLERVSSDARVIVSPPGVEPGLSRPRRDALTTRR